MCVLLLTILGYDGIQVTDLLGMKDWQAVILATFLLIAYPFGIIFDRLADSLFVRWDNRIRQKFFSDVNLPFRTMLFEMGKDNDNLHEYFEYSRSRIRITRAASLNFGLTTVFSLALLVVRGQGLTSDSLWYYGFWITIAGSFITLAATYAWYKLTMAYFTLVTKSYESIKRNQIG